MERRISNLNRVLSEQREKFRIEHTSVFKNNGILDGFILKNPDQAVSLMIYLNEDQLKLSDKALIDYLCSVYQSSDLISFDPSVFLSEEYILAHVLPRLYADTNASAMEEKNLSFCLMPAARLLMGWYLPVSSTEGSSATINLTNRFLSETKLSFDEIKNHSIKNMQQISYISNLSSCLNEALGMELDVGNKLYLVSNRSHLFGASAILCPGIIGSLNDTLGNRFYILPASIHETLCLAYQEEARDELFKMVCNINASQVSDVDRLLDGVLLYDGKKIIAA